MGASSPARIPLPVFVCPSDGARGAARPANNFRVCTGLSPDAFKDASTSEGAFTVLYRHSPAEFTDGLSNTAGASEKVVGSESGGYSRVRDFWYSGISNLGMPLPDADGMDAVCSSLTLAPVAFFPYAGQTWFYAGYEFTWYNHTTGPNAATPDCSVLPANTAPVPSIGGVFRATSYHSGGVNCMLMDGSVRFFNDDVSLPVWRALAGGEALASNGI